MLYFSLSKNCTYKDASASTLRLPTEALPRLWLGHITRYIWIRFATPKFLPLAKTSDIPKTLCEIWHCNLYSGQILPVGHFYLAIFR